MRSIALLGALILTVGCASVDWDAPKTQSSALAGSPKAGLAAALASHPDESGFLLLSDGIEAFGARLVMARRARVSLDAQYYFILDDVTGNAFFRELLRAADRGVRVRLLLDDIATQGYDPGLAALNSHPHFEVRIFNPFTRSKGRLLSGVTEFSRVNRRMHNKSFTADGLVTLIGGRNIGDEYFAANEEVNFGDLDVLGGGPVARQVGSAFDDYWNSEAAVPISVLVPVPEDPAADLARVRERLDASIAEFDGTPYRAALESTVLEQFELAPESLEWAAARVVFDAPEKSRAGTDADDAVAGKLRAPLRDAIEAATQELIVISPYFVPLDTGVEALCELEARGVQTTILTNGLASTDVSAVHAGYAPYRKDLLECGVELFEVRKDTTLPGRRRSKAGMSGASLHAKGFVVDRHQLFVGSFNWDPRSAGINTEMGVLIDSPVLATNLVERIEQRRNQTAYRVYLEDGRMRWVTQFHGQEVVKDKEPDTSFWQRFTAGLLRIVPIRSQL